MNLISRVLKSALSLILLSSVAFADCDTANALMTLRPKAEWNLRGNTIEWLDQTQTQPTNLQIAAAILACQNDDAALKQQIRNDIFNIRLSTNTAATKLQYLIDLMQLRGQL